MNRAQLIEELRRDEGVRLKPYKDTVGKWTIACGRNLSDNGISTDEMLLMLHNDIDAASKGLDRALPWWREMSEPRQRALVNMCFNLGLPRLLQFKTMLRHLEAGEYEAAADAALDSRWALQVGERSDRIAELFRKG